MIKLNPAGRREDREGKDKLEGNKIFLSERTGGYSTNHQRSEGIGNVREDWGMTHLGGSPNDLGKGLNIVELVLSKGLFPWKILKILLVRGTTSFCKGNCNFAHWRE